ncbi:hypothetical protein [Lactobacillus helveticus]|uniref:hypothetical protein n=2 Tax=Lactobacillus helveticus TaxID=1587 RepID=UPI00046D074D|nr:hypothetical protein [Lactobacillus helveticus]NRO08671.1 hypothetical protein [Lactobacillus helveticus]NRO20810.1 hypothetical protein [Lactobacillus helveticus]NRO32959.1 hypothetical protein [Lactobacillus helveticus]NRO41095.1 hypothetical protein [Lactobacillus helveticus]NRO46593.1 hypothetical protein [Lactobacillus helveticus]
MKRYRPNTKAVIVGILCWVIKASFIPKGALYLFPVGLLLICVGGLELTITAFIAMRKNDLAMSGHLRAIEDQRKKAEIKKSQYGLDLLNYNMHE